jgi:hypothetical protein
MAICDLPAPLGREITRWLGGFALSSRALFLDEESILKTLHFLK